MTTLKEALEVVRNAGYKVTMGDCPWDITSDNSYTAVLGSIISYEIGEYYFGSTGYGVVEDVMNNKDGTFDLLVKLG